MTRSDNKIQNKDERITGSPVKEEVSACLKSHLFGSMNNIAYQTPKSLNGQADEVFMQLQTELFDILLEIYNLIPMWGSFKENFYFHWKRIIGAFCFKDLHAYRLIFRCLGNLRPSSAPLFAIKPIIKQLDEYRRISEPEYLPVDFELKADVKGSFISGAHTPPLLMFHHLQSLNVPNTSIKGQRTSTIENKSGFFPFTEQSNPIMMSRINNVAISALIPTENKNNEGSISVSPKGFANLVSQQGKHSEDSLEGIKCPHNKLVLPNIRNQNIYHMGKTPSESHKINEKLNDANDNCFSEESCSSELFKGSYSLPTCHSSNSTNSPPYSTSCTASTLSPSEFDVSGPIMAAFHHIQAVAVAAAVANNGNNMPNITGQMAANECITQPPKKRPRRNGEIQGVYFDKIRKLWRANWKENGRVKTKGFSVFQFGDEGARQRAIDYRRKMEKEFYILPHSSKLQNLNSINDEPLPTQRINEITKV